MDELSAFNSQILKAKIEQSPSAPLNSARQNQDPNNSESSFMSKYTHFSNL